MPRPAQRSRSVPSLREYVRGLQLHELELADLLEARRDAFSRHPGVYAAVERVRVLAARQRGELSALLGTLRDASQTDEAAVNAVDAVDAVDVADAPLAPPASIEASIAGPHPVSDALVDLQGVLRRTAAGYQRLWVAGSSLGSANTFRLAAEHMRAYAAAASELIPLVSEVMVWELREAGEDCRCACAACGGLGTCLCGPSSAILMERATRETVPDEPIGAPVWFIRYGSPASRAGLRSGDRIVAADGAEIRDPWSLVSAATAAEKYGAPLTLTVERANGATERVSVAPRRRPDVSDELGDQRQS